MPDHTTLCRFRNLLIQKNLLAKILQAINEDLEMKGLKVEKSVGAIVDATLIASGGRAKKITETYSKDSNARWIKKRGKSTFGCKNFTVVDQEEGYIEQVHVTPANEAEYKQLETILNKAPKQYV